MDVVYVIPIFENGIERNSQAYKKKKKISNKIIIIIIIIIKIMNYILHKRQVLYITVAYMLFLSIFLCKGLLKLWWEVIDDKYVIYLSISYFQVFYFLMFFLQSLRIKFTTQMSKNHT